MVYIDTSVLIAYYWPESLSAAAQSEIRKAEGPAISPLSEVEFHSALALKKRMKEMDEESARRILSAFRVHRADGVYRVVPIEAREYLLSCEWLGTFRTSLRALDALHLAAAFSNGLTLITADRILAESAKHFGVKYRLVA
jgi:predicted nucleic acid-binding protein